MSSQKLSDLLEEIDSLISDYLHAKASVEPRMIVGHNINLEEFLEHGAFPPSDPRSPSGAALLSIALKQRDRGGNARLASVLAAYRQKYGAKRSAVLNARWHYLAEQ